MNIRQILALGTGAVFSLSLGTGVAFAQGPDSEECENARKAVVTLETQVTNVAAEENVREREALEVARNALNDAQKVLRDLEAKTNPPATREELKAARDAVQLARDVRDARQRDLDTDSNRLAGLRAQLRLAIEDRDESCATPEPTPTPAPTTTVPPPADPADQFDCDDFATRADAQNKLNETPDADPHNLDADNDRIACEEFVFPGEDDDDAPVPSGGVDTGDGSSL